MYWDSLPSMLWLEHLKKYKFETEVIPVFTIANSINTYTWDIHDSFVKTLLLPKLKGQVLFWSTRDLKTTVACKKIELSPERQGLVFFYNPLLKEKSLTEKILTSPDLLKELASNIESYMKKEISQQTLDLKYIEFFGTHITSGVKERENSIKQITSKQAEILIPWIVEKCKKIK